MAPLIPRLALAGFWAAAVLAHLASGPDLRERAWPMAYGLLEALACLSLLLRAWKTSGAERTAWGFLGASALADTANLALAALAALGLPPPLEGLTSALNLATGALVVVGVLSFPRPRERRGRGKRQFLDSLIFATSLLLLLWVMGVQTSLRSAGTGMGFRVFLAYLNAALLGGGVVYITSGHLGRARGAFGWLAASALAWLASLTLWTLWGLPPRVNREGWIVIAGLIPLCQGLAAWTPHSVDGGDPRTEGPWRFFRSLPYLPMAAGIAALSWILAWRPEAVTRETFGIFLILVVFLVLRMLQAIRDLQASNTHLEQRVAQRTQALERAQETLLRTERMNTLATLGAGLTHDLNNLLGALRGSAELLHAHLEQGQEPSRRDVQRIIDISEKASQTTQRLMNFGRRGETPRGSTARDIAEALAASREIMRMLLPDTITLSLGIDPATCPALVETATLEQVLVNLVSNAKDAMPQGGAVAIRLFSGTTAEGASAAILEVSDTGHGISPEVQESIFDPFFTTKPEGKGTGLGLASVRALMRAQNGTVDVVSFPGKGTTFRLAFPALP
ncbi:hypothetical protein METEAL_19870 [Mesoterricola silvestris]|uniref:histidine kinase n=1 Tax=Mesoterricola silvestris TaxID=2927979 RepID=A0AA48H6N2_9BACT|nr:hypothetical protein METEAL_19870 [Mesoterricola silvestris]